MQISYGPIRPVSPDLGSGTSRTKAAPADRPVKIIYSIAHTNAQGHKIPTTKTNPNMFLTSPRL
jgi:hypothetical protein